MSSIHSIITRLKQLKRKADTVFSSATEVVKELDIILRDSELLAKGIRNTFTVFVCNIFIYFVINHRSYIKYHCASTCTIDQ